MRLLKRLFVTAVALTGCLAASCTLLVDTDGLAGDPATTPADAGSDAPSLDRTDDGRSNDSAIDTPLDAEAGTTRFCPVPGALLCADFDDDDASLPGPFGNVASDVDSQLQIVTTRSSSAPRSLQMQIGTGTHHAIAGTDFKSGNGATLAFDIYIDSRGGNLTAASFVFDDGVGALFLQPQDDDKTSVTEAFTSGATTSYESTDAPAIPRNAWTRVSIDVDFTTRIVGATFGGTTTNRTMRAPWGVTTMMTGSVGTVASDNALVFYDNVVLTLR